MKKLASIIATITAIALVLVGCSTKTEEKKETTNTPKVVKVASHTAPMTDMLELVKEDLAKEGYTLEIVKVSDNVQANVALNNKEVDANFFQHKLFMQMFNEGNKANLVQVQPIYDAVVAFYGKDLKNISDLKEGADVAIPSDPTNMTRALRLLAEHKVITLKDPKSFSVKVEDIVENPKNLKFSPISLLNLNEAYNEKDLVFNYPAYATKIGLTPEKDGLIKEETGDLTFAVSLVAREDNKDSKEVEAVKKALTGDKVKEFINTKLAKVAKVAF
ncbi:MetQ/NlpA family ABC transporter substrate-binding protein [Gemelliphila palaticanis]|uniref:Lipoprotein n=1 Tax=Gemelliphila palaticanis TaxID=81950 RepID=A0ABX2T232_9BACL|nr:MetQ/NlpA family ABC transporter substrate-binding protein [Gemella palaticanis]MBF0715768.1 hypothetical protein [Gemella palaticanis]NYS47698.1 hypothetical protein [Gemella palaticanis]